MTSLPADDQRAPASALRPVDTPEASRARTRLTIWRAGLALFCAGALLLLWRHIDGTMPYPYHADEGFISGPASNILVKGDLHPPRFNYPSLPTYLAAGAMAFGFVRGAAHLEIRDVSQIGQVGYPYYDTPRVMRTARQAFAFLSALCLAMTGLSAWMAFRKPAAMVLAPLLLFAGTLYFRHSWLYLNVDIVGTCFVMVTLAACLAGMRQPSIVRSAILPGIAAGLATGSKYTLALVIVPVLLGIGLYFPRERVLAGWSAALGAMVLAFLAAVPYSIVDIPGFLNGVGYEVFHYASGHAGFAGEPGWEQVVYYSRHFADEFGYVAAVLAMGGLALFAMADWRQALVVAAFPAALLWLLTGQRVHFTRNALPAEPFLAMFAAYAVIAIHGWLMRAAARRQWTRRRIPLGAVAGIGLVLAVVPVWHIADDLRDRTDSRNLARAWVADELPYNWAIVLPSELGFDRKGLEIRSRHIKVVDLRSARDPEAVNALLADVPSPAVMFVPRWGADRRSPGQKAADALNALTSRWKVVKTFGSNDVLVNYWSATAWGDPAFAIAIVK